MDPTNPRPPSEVVLDEVYALALAGRPAEALEVLDVFSGSDAVTLDRIELARARALLAVGEPRRQQGLALLERLEGTCGGVRWRARLSLARERQREGRMAEAARLIKRGIEELRRERAPGREPLEKLLSLDVENLQGPRDDAPAYDTRELLALIELGRRLGGETDPDELLPAVLHEAVGLVGADRGFVVRCRGDSFEFVAAENLDRSAIDEPSFEVSRSLIDQVRRTGRIELVTLAALPEAHPARDSLALLGVHAVACVPLNGAEEPIGVMYLDAKNRKVLAPDRRPFLELLAAQAVLALENARSHRQVTLDLERAEAKIRRHHSESDRRTAYDGMLGASRAMQSVYARLDRIVPTSEPVIVQGETGTGKELAARLIHDRGPRQDREFVAVNCAGLAEPLLESELFGHERGAFTGADRARAGLLEVADRGTLFLDEIADMPQRMQGDLLRVLQSGEVRRVGGRKTTHVDVRVIAASNRPLRALVDRGRFREDLYYRLNVLELALPPLRERADDIALLVQHLMPQINPGSSVPSFTRRALARLEAYPWPGNVRELQNVLRRIAVQRLDVVDEQNLPSEVRDSGASAPAGTLREAEDEAIRRALKEADGNKSHAARLLGVDRRTLYNKMRRLGLH